MDFQAFKDWFMSLGTQYGVNPIIFGSIYVGAIPFFTLSVAWVMRNLRKKRSIILPLLSTGFFFVSAYLYLIIVGHNVPLWVYAFIAGMVIFGVISTVKKIRKKLEEPNAT
ncbi:MAG: hypothetical protein HY707_05520 [Ignavibacteriae bacterium]|nr:hypothetical protein [Ignavibacteriota bacterium]